MIWIAAYVIVGVVSGGAVLAVAPSEWLEGDGAILLPLLTALVWPVWLIGGFSYWVVAQVKTANDGLKDNK
jgi:hypothetical protein